MLSDSERRRLAAIEDNLRADRHFTDRLEHARNAANTRRVIAVVVAGCALIGTIVALAVHSVAGAVAGICAVGVAGHIWTWQPRR